MTDRDKIALSFAYQSFQKESGGFKKRKRRRYQRIEKETKAQKIVRVDDEIGVNDGSERKATK